MDPTTYAVIAAAVLVGSDVQSAVGLGVGLVAAPVTALLEPALMPGALLMVALLMPCLTLVYDHHDIDWPGLGWSLPARVPGTAGRRLGGHHAHRARARDRDRRRGAGRGRGHLARVRGPGQPGTPVAPPGSPAASPARRPRSAGRRSRSLYQHRPAREIRTTMAVYFLIGAALSPGRAARQPATSPATRRSPRSSCSPFLAPRCPARRAVARRSIPAHVVRPGGAAGQLGIGPRPARAVPARDER